MESKSNYFFQLFSQEKINELSQKFLEILFSYQQATITSLEPEQIDKLNIFIYSFLNIFFDDNFIVPEPDIEIFIRLNPVISNLIAVSDIKNSDAFLKTFVESRITANRLIKILTLYSSRNKIEFNYHELFSVEPKFSSIWYWSYFRTIDFISETSFHNMQKHADLLGSLNKLDIPFQVNPQLSNNNFLIPYIDQDALFISSYIDPDKDIEIKHKINAIIKKNLEKIKIVNTPDKRKIAIVSAHLFPNHAVYRGHYDFIKSLAEDYELTLVSLGKFKLSEKTIFKEEIHLEFKNNYLDISPLNNNSFAMVYFPDIGLSAESAFLSNIRIAPIQATGLGHSVSTYGAEIDYFISGQKNEITNLISKNYSERLVLLPGLGLYPTYPEHNLPNKSSTNTEKLLIVCPWSFQKVNYPHLLTLKEILEKSNKEIIFRFLISNGKNVSFLVYRNEIAEILGEKNIEVFPGMPYSEYMKLVDQATLVIDSSHFAGYTTIIDALYLNKPVVTMQGDKAYNLFTSAILEKIGLCSLISHNKDEYVQLVLQLINDENYRDSIVEIITKADIKSKIYDSSEPKYFKEAIDVLIGNHENLIKENSKKPIIVTSDG